MRVAVVGMGAIGSTFAFALSRAGHEVTAIARGQRLATLEQERAVVTKAGERANVTPAGVLDPSVTFDLVLVTVLAHQLEPLIPQLRASSARTVMFMFNTTAPLSSFRELVGERFAFGFPAILASLTDGALEYEVFTLGQVTIVTEARWAEVFTRAGIKTQVQPQMQSWLRTHAVLISIVLSVACRAVALGGGVSWGLARTHAWALREGLELVRAIGDRVIPFPLAVLGALPTFVRTGLLWLASRLGVVRKAAAPGPKEAIALIGELTALAPNAPAEALRELRDALTA